MGYSHLLRPADAARLAFIGLLIALVWAFAAKAQPAQEWHDIELLPGVRPVLSQETTTGELSQDDFQRVGPNELWGMKVERTRWLPAVRKSKPPFIPSLTVLPAPAMSGVEIVIQDDSAGTKCALAKAKVGEYSFNRALDRYIQCQGGLVYVVAELVTPD